MKILVTGATGLIGSAVVRLILARKYKVHYLTRSKDKIKHTAVLKGFYWNPELGEVDMKCFEGIDAIINLAGAPIAKRWTAAYKKQIVQSRVLALQMLYRGISALNEHHIVTMVTASAIGIYPDSHTNYYGEDFSEISTSFLGDVVMQWEGAAERFKEHHLTVAKIRIGLVLAEKGGALPPIVKSVKYYVGAPFGTGTQWQSWIHIMDIARLFLFAVENKLEGIYNGVAPNPITQQKLVNEVASYLKRPLFLPGIPKGILAVILGEMVYVLYASQRVSAQKVIQNGFTFTYTNIHQALEDLLSYG